MIQKRDILRAAADRGVQQTIEFYLTEGSQQAALKSIDALEQALHDTEHHPAFVTSARAKPCGTLAIAAQCIRCILPPLGLPEAAQKRCAVSDLRNAEE